MKRGGVDHLKTVRLARHLGVPHLIAVGLLESLWHFTVKHAIRGDIGRATDEEIEHGLRWPEVVAAIPTVAPLIPTLIACGFLDLDASHRLLVHDWPEHADQSVKKTLSNRGHDFARPSDPSVSGNVPSERVEGVTPVTGKATALERKESSTEEEDRTAARARDPKLSDLRRRHPHVEEQLLGYFPAYEARFGAPPTVGELRQMTDTLRGAGHSHEKIRRHWAVYLDADENPDDPRFLSAANFTKRFDIYDPDHPEKRERPARRPAAPPEPVIAAAVPPKPGRVMSPAELKAKQQELAASAAEKLRQHG